MIIDGADYLTLICPLILGVMGTVMAIDRRWAAAFIVLGLLGTVASIISVHGAHVEQAELRAEVTGGDSYAVLTAQFFPSDSDKQQMLLWITNKGDYALHNVTTTVSPTGQIFGTPGYASLGIGHVAAIPAHGAFSTGISIPMKTASYDIEVTADNGTVRELLKIEMIDKDLKQSAVVTKNGNKIDDFSL